MVGCAGITIRNGATAEMLSRKLTSDDITTAINDKKKGKRPNGAGGRFLSALDSVAKSVPHSNENTGKARTDAYAHQFYFGMASYFLTVTPDDENCLLVQILTNNDVDVSSPSTELRSNEDLRKAAEKRRQIRVRFPGACALYFEHMLDILIRDVIGWDTTSCKPTSGFIGLFGIPQAFVVAVEEQGRRTLHAHVQIWVEDFSTKRHLLYDDSETVRRRAERQLCAKIDEVMSNALVRAKYTSRNNYDGCFHHECSKVKSKTPCLFDDQRLRVLRHVSGRHSVRNLSHYCPSCIIKVWTAEEIVESFLIDGIQIPSLTEFPDNEAKRLKAIAIEHQKRNCTRDGDLYTQASINAAYNFHIHTNSCYQHATITATGNLRTSMRKSRRKRKKNSNLNHNECRFRYPKRAKTTTSVENITSDPVAWYTWYGKEQTRHLKEFSVRRGDYDIFQNTSCPAISLSKMTCNTNLSALTPGPACQYSFKYSIKDTQDDDTEEYMKATEKLQKTMIKVSEQLDDDIITEFSAAIRTLLAASFENQTKHIVGAAMASFLTRRGSRFIFSHKTVWCPIEDIYKVLTKAESYSASIQYNAGIPFFVCRAYDYLCRPLELEKISALNFYTGYEVKVSRRKKKGSLYEFINTTYNHPSYDKENEYFRQGVAERSTKYIAKLRFWYCFKDSANFGASILDTEAIVTEEMEEYSRYALLLFLPYREHNDILENGSYTSRFRTAVFNNEICLDDLRYLQNLQDTCRNCLRHPMKNDDLQRDTVPFETNEEVLLPLIEEEEQEVEDEPTPDERVGEDLDEFIERLCSEADISFREETEEIIPSSMCFNEIKQKGSKRCGYELPTRITVSEDDSADPFIVVPSVEDSTSNNTSGINSNNENRVYRNELVRLLLTKVHRRARSFSQITGKDKSFDVLDANGSAESIIDWAKKASLDRQQRRAFEIITSAAILAFHGDALEESENLSTYSRKDYNVLNRERRKLRRLGEVKKRGGRDQLIMLMHGPGGCGKTTVLDLMMTYVKEFCDDFSDYEFTSRTIVVTALTGVAATLLMGQTTSAALYLNQKREYTAEQYDAWRDTKMVIIDEVSFAHKRDIQKIQRMLCKIKENNTERYGGINVVYSGDFRQLEPVGPNKYPLYKERCVEFDNLINCYIELKGMHRFQNDSDWGQLLMRFRNGEATMDDIHRINRRVILSSQELSSIPNDIKYATYYNRDRDAINTALFEERCRNRFDLHGNIDDSIIILADEMKTKNGSSKWIPFKGRRIVWQHCGEDDLRPSKSARQDRVDPALKLYRGCQVMLPSNEDVLSGKANGTQAIVERVVLKSNDSCRRTIVNGNLPVPTVRAGDVKEIHLRHVNPRISPATFIVTAKSYTSITARVPTPMACRINDNDREGICLSFKQIPVIVNNATTGHKLQGSSIDNIFIHAWNYSANWPYVVLSRVRTIKGLYLREPLSMNLKKYKVDKALEKMISRFRAKGITEFTEEEYDDIINYEYS